MDELTIDEILGKHPLTKKIYKGTFAIDELSQIISYPSILVVNTAKRFEPGEHWLGMYFKLDRSAVFFDSYGHHPSFYQIEDFIKANSNNYYYNPKRLQGSSNYCGLYVIGFLISLRQNKIKKFFNYLNKSPDRNDDLIKNLLS